MSHFAKQNIFLSVSLMSTIGFATIGCESHKKKDTKSDAPITKEVEPIDTVLKPLNRTDKNKFTFNISSTVKGAKFKCSIVPEAQDQAMVTNWTDCSENWTVDIAPGQNYVARAKAIDASGKEDQLPAVYNIQAAAPEQKPATQVEVKTLILDKDNIPAEISKKELTIEFGAEAPGIDPADIAYECKNQGDLTYRRCPQKDRYTFSDLKDGNSYRLNVKAVVSGNSNTKVKVTEDEIRFAVKRVALELGGTQALASNRTGKYKIQLPKNAGSLKCSVTRVTSQNTGTQEAKECQDVYELNLDTLEKGSYQFTVKNEDGDEKTVSFCAQVCSDADLGQQPNNGSPRPNGSGGVVAGGGGGGVVAGGGGGGVIAGGGGGGVIAGGVPTPSVHQIGSFYAYTVQPGMHVTQYATTKTPNNVLSFFRIGNDPYYVGNYSCDSMVDRRVVWQSPSGLPYEYCNSTPRRDDYKFLTEGRLANNHIEVATDHTIVQKNPDAQERIFINVFDQDYEYMFERSRFSALCAENVNARGRVTKSPMVPVFDFNYWGNFTKASIFACWGQFAADGPGIPTLSNGWWIGAFYITSDDNLPAFECLKNDWSYDRDRPDHGHDYGLVSPQWCGSYKNKSLIEVVYMTRKPFQQDYLFMQELQAKFRGLLLELRPRQSTY